MSRRVTRRSQSVVPFGVGSIVEFENEALMPAGLEAWPPEAVRITDDRLAGRLGVNHFRVPPPKPDKNGVPGTMAPLPYVRFPQWHFCPRCRFLKKADLYAPSRPRCDNPDTSPRLAKKKPCGSFPESRQPRMRPLRFVAVCEAGHIEDFPWNAWAHSKRGEELERGRGCDPESLYFYPTKAGGMTGLVVSCACGEKRSLLGSTNQGGLKGLTCLGERPWLGKEGSTTCSAPPAEDGGSYMMALQRGASNLYFPSVMSSILIPPFSSRVHRVLREARVWDILTSSRVDGEIPESVFKTVARMRNVNAEQLREAFEAKMSNGEIQVTDLDETAFRREEYAALQQERRDEDDLLACRPQALDKYSEVVQNYFDQITLVERLAETRALTGFHRITPGGVNESRLSQGHINWLPAFRVHGEGIFLSLRRERMDAFAEETDSSLERFLTRIRESGRCPLVVSPELILLHTLAHLLIKRLSFEAGYGASSIRERIYSAPEGDKSGMCGMLLYTAAGDADGTLGGLVGLGQPGTLDRALESVLEESMWCASDPICAESQGQGPDSLNLAACHACALLPETSCEVQNRFLDRTVVNRFFADATA